MNETQKRIKAYQEALPVLRERVVAVAFLLAMSLAMVTSASFAWLTISKAPEVSGVDTTVAANGNLEIALVNPEGTEPGASGISDSFSAEGQNMVTANMTWGNLVNLTDPSYGLDQMALRPAQINDTGNMNRFPLYGAIFGRDGRVVGVSEYYGYASYATAPDGVTKYFAAGDDAKYGVRAIASMRYDNVTSNAVYDDLIAKARTGYTDASAKYKYLITAGKDSSGVRYLDSLSGLIQVFVQDKANGIGGTETDSNCSQYIPSIHELMVEFTDVLDFEGAALLSMANLQAYINGGDGASTNTFEDLDDLLEATNAELTAAGVNLQSLANYKTSRATLIRRTAEMGVFADQVRHNSSTVVKWSDISAIANDLVNVSTAELNGMQVGSLGGDDLGTLLSAAFGGGSNNVVIKSGLLKDLEQRIGTRMGKYEDMGQGIVVTITVKYIITKAVSARISTNAEAPFSGKQDLARTEDLDTSGISGEAVAEDIYGMAIDLWARTNANNVVLKLEGTVTYEEVPATGYDKNGKEVPLYTITLEGAEIDVYQMTVGEQTTWHYAGNHQTINPEGMEDVVPVPKMKQVPTGFYGENRIWEEWQTMLENQQIAENSTTQGAGSCYTFYADGPDEKDRIKNLLKSVFVAFVDDSGQPVATAVLDTENAVDINAKVVVPMKLVSGTEYQDAMGATQMGIMPLERNKAERLTAIVYLNGTNLSNKDVLASNEIEGQLNIQFGSSVALNVKEDEKLQNEYRTITAEAFYGEERSSSTNDPIEFTYTGETRTIRVDLSVDGDAPKTVKGFFIRAINSTQGSRGETVTFTRDTERNVWTADFDLSKPGTYILRSVFADGIEIDMTTHPTVSISGLQLAGINCIPGGGIIMTADSYADVDVTVAFAGSADLLPSRVRAQFRSTAGREYTGILTYDAINNQWTGTVRIASSGTYTLEYIIRDSDYDPVPDNMQTTVITFLGMTTRVESAFDGDGDGIAGEAEDFNFEYTGERNVPFRLKIWDDSGREMVDLDGVTLYYHADGSSLDQNGMTAVLERNSQTGYYEGTARLRSPGIFRFDRVTLVTTDSNGNASTSVIRDALLSPTFTAIAKEPPQYYADVADYEYQFVTDGTAALHMELVHARAASVWARMTNVNTGSSELVPMTTRTNLEDVTVNSAAAPRDLLSFRIPATGGSQDGEWKITELYFQNVYIPDGLGGGTMYPVTEDEELTEDNCYVMDVSDKGTHDQHGIYTYVVSKVVSKLTLGNSTTAAAYTGEAFGGTRANPTGTFMQAHTQSDDMYLTVADWKGNGIQGVAGAKMTVTYQIDSLNYGGYSGASLAPYELTAEGTSQFVFPKQTFRLAGTYRTTVVLTDAEGNTVYTVSGAPTFTVASVKPAVAITAIYKEGSYPVCVGFEETSDGCNTTTTPMVEDDLIASKTATSATVYFEYYEDSGWVSNHRYYHPWVTITLSGYGSATGASLQFTKSDGGDVLLHTSANGGTSGRTDAYTWTQNGGTKMYIGEGTAPTGRDNTKTVAGIITANQLIMTYGGVNYTVNVDTITIENPY